jgi:hypothetical protein
MPVSDAKTAKLPAERKISKKKKQHIPDFNSGTAIWFSGKKLRFLSGQHHS